MTENIFRKGPSELAKIEKGLKSIENELLEECEKVVYSAVTHTFDIEVGPDGTVDTPHEWTEELEECVDEEDRQKKLRELDRRKRIAKYALMPPKEAPVALQIAAKALGGMQKAKAMSGAAPRELNLTLVSFSAPEQQAPMFPVKEIKHE